MKMSPFVYFGRSRYLGSRVGEFITFLEEATGKRPQDFLFIDPYSIGDCVQSLGFLPAFRRVYCQEGQRIIFLCQERAQKLSLVMPYADHCVGMSLSPHELALEYVASLSNTLSPDHPIVCAIDMHARGQLVRVGAPHYNIKRAVFFLNQSEQHTPPVVSDALRTATAARMRDAGVVEGRSMVFFPHGLTFIDFGTEFWAGIVRHVQAVFPEMTMFTDVTTGNPSLPGTSPLTLGVEDLISAVEFAGNAVFLRSGLVDVCAWTSANVFSVVPPPSGYRHLSAGVRPEDMYTKQFYPNTTVTDYSVTSADPAEAQALAEKICLSIRERSAVKP